MKYILKEKIPFTKYQVGHVFDTDFQGDIHYEAECDGAVPYNTILPHEILLMVKAGILEEYDETFPKMGDGYWYIGSDSLGMGFVLFLLGRFVGWLVLLMLDGEIAELLS